MAPLRTFLASLGVASFRVVTGFGTLTREMRTDSLTLALTKQFVDGVNRDHLMTILPQIMASPGYSKMLNRQSWSFFQHLAKEFQNPTQFAQENSSHLKLAAQLLNSIPQDERAKLISSMQNTVRTYLNANLKRPTALPAVPNTPEMIATPNAPEMSPIPSSTTLTQFGVTKDAKFEPSNTLDTRAATASAASKYTQADSVLESIEGTNQSEAATQNADLPREYHVPIVAKSHGVQPQHDILTELEEAAVKKILQQLGGLSPQGQRPHRRGTRPTQHHSYLQVLSKNKLSYEGDDDNYEQDDEQDDEQDEEQDEEQDDDQDDDQRFTRLGADGEDIDDEFGKGGEISDEGTNENDSHHPGRNTIPEHKQKAVPTATKTIEDKIANLEKSIHNMDSELKPCGSNEAALKSTMESASSFVRIAQLGSSPGVPRQAGLLSSFIMPSL